MHCITHYVPQIEFSTGLISTVAGTGGYTTYTGPGPATSTSGLNSPSGLAFDADGNMYVNSIGFNPVMKVAV